MAAMEKATKLHSLEFKEQNWPQEDVSNVRNKGSNYALISHRKRNTETNIKQRLASSVRELTGTLQGHAFSV